MNRCFSMNINSAVFILIWLLQLWKKILVDMSLGLLYHSKRCFNHQNKRPSLILKWLQIHYFWNTLVEEKKKKLEMSSQEFLPAHRLVVRWKGADFTRCPGSPSCQPRSSGLAACHLWWASSSLCATRVTLKQDAPHRASSRAGSILPAARGGPAPAPSIAAPGPKGRKGLCNLQGAVQIWSTGICLMGCKPLL